MDETSVELAPQPSANLDLGALGTGDTVTSALQAVFPEYKVLIENGIKDPTTLKILDRFEDREMAIAGCQYMFDAFEQQGVDCSAVASMFDRYGESIYYGLYRAIEGGDEPEAVAEDILTGAEIVDASIDRRNYPFPVFSKPGLDALPRLNHRMHALGLDDSLASSIFESWSTYDEAAKSFKYGYFQVSQTGSEQQSLVEELAKNQARAYTLNIHKMEKFADAYGVDGLRAVIDTFGIYNFARHEPGWLKDQLDAWQAGEPVKSIVIDPRHDWNSFGKSPAVFKGDLAEGVFYFESNSGADIARVAASIGKHERSNGREPAVRFFVIHAHGWAGGMDLGTNGEDITTNHYRSLNSRNRPNNYKRHLGHDFEIILLSCSTAAPAAQGMNIAETMSRHHGVTVHACNTTTSALTISSEGGIDFQTEDGKGELISYLN